MALFDGDLKKHILYIEENYNEYYDNWKFLIKNNDTHWQRMIFNRHPELRNIINQNIIPLGQILFHIFKGIERTICGCGNFTKFYNYNNGYFLTCSNKCQRKYHCYPKRIKTYLEKYGVDNPAKNPEVYNKVKKTNLEKYGAECILTLNQIKENIKQSNLEKYGFEHPMQNKDIRKKVEDTNFIKYGNTNAAKNIKVRDKIRENVTNIWNNRTKDDVDKIIINRKNTEIKLDELDPLRREKIQEKYRNTSIKNYGVSHPHKSEKIISKRRKTCMEKYGVEHPLQTPEIFQKLIRSQIRFKEYIKPDGTIIFVQGYEGIVLDKLYKHYNVNNILAGNEIDFSIQYNLNGTIKWYHPDIYLINDNRILEIKSNYTFKKEKEKNFAKRLGAINSGFNFNFVIR